MSRTEWTTYNPPSQPLHGEGQPSTVNSISFRRHRVVVEEIDESDDVLRDRLMALCANGTNHHQWGAWTALQRRYGFVIGGYKQPARVANDNDRAIWAKEDEQQAINKAKQDAKEEADRIARNAKAKARRDAKKATP